MFKVLNTKTNTNTEYINLTKMEPNSPPIKIKDGKIVSITFNHPSGDVTVTNPSNNSVVKQKIINAHACPCCRCGKTISLRFKNHFVGKYRLVYMNMWGNVPREWNNITEKTQMIMINLPSRDYDDRFVVQFVEEDGTQFNADIARY